MLTADAVYTIAKALSKEELITLYDLLSQDVKREKITSPVKKVKKKYTDIELRNMLLEKVFNVKLKES